MDQRLRRAGTQTGTASNGCSTQRPFALFLIDCLNDLLMAIPLRVVVTSRNVLMRGRSEKSAARHGHAATIGVSLSGMGPLPSPCGLHLSRQVPECHLWGHPRPGLFASGRAGEFSLACGCRLSLHRPRCRRRWSELYRITGSQVNKFFRSQDHN